MFCIFYASMYICTMSQFSLTDMLILNTEKMSLAKKHQTTKDCSYIVTDLVSVQFYLYFNYMIEKILFSSTLTFKEFQKHL